MSQDRPHNQSEDRPPDPEGPHKPGRHWLRWIIVAVVGVAVLTFGLTYGRRWLVDYLTTEYTDDAYVNGHYSSISPRVTGKVLRVHVDDNDRVEAGQLLLELDPEPYQVVVDQKRAALQVAQANLTATSAQMRSQEAMARANWFSLVQAQEQVRFQIATLRTNVADLRLEQANLTLAEQERARVAKLVARQAAAPEELERRQADERVARQRVASAEETVQRTRAALGLPPDAKRPTDVPDDLTQTFSAVQVALSQTAQALAKIGVPIKLYNLTPDALHKQLFDSAPSGDLNQALDLFVQKAPAVLQARASVEQARQELRDAELNLRYTRIHAPIAGAVSQRNVNPGNNVTAGQAIMAVRSTTDVWIDANFRENQINDLRIGQPVLLRIDAYPDKTFHGRVEGFSPGAGASLALIPPENATGNFVKIVQRLPVRITVDPDDLSEDTPLFIGLSVQPRVLVKEKPTGPNAGARLLRPKPQTPKAGGGGRR